MLYQRYWLGNRELGDARTEQVNSQVIDLGVERPKLRNGFARVELALAERFRGPAAPAALGQPDRRPLFQGGLQYGIIGPALLARLVQNTPGAARPGLRNHETGDKTRRQKVRCGSGSASSPHCCTQSRMRWRG
jgi:hypothetical protein